MSLTSWRPERAFVKSAVFLTVKTRSNHVERAYLTRPLPQRPAQGKSPVSIFLVNGIKLQGQIESFDQFVVLLKNTVSQMVYKHAISTVVPARNVRLPAADDEASAED